SERAARAGVIEIFRHDCFETLLLCAEYESRGRATYEMEHVASLPFIPPTRRFDHPAERCDFPHQRFDQGLSSAMGQEERIGVIKKDLHFSARRPSDRRTESLRGSRPRMKPRSAVGNRAAAN